MSLRLNGDPHAFSGRCGGAGTEPDECKCWCGGRMHGEALGKSPNLSRKFSKSRIVRLRVRSGRRQDYIEEALDTLREARRILGRA